jgi:hypothetical protein
MPLRLFHLGASVHEAFWSGSLMARRPLFNQSTADLQIHHLPSDQTLSAPRLAREVQSLTSGHLRPSSIFPITYASLPLSH